MPDHGSRAGGRGPSQLAVRVIRELQQLGGKGPLTCMCPCSPRLPCCAEPAASERRPMPDEPWLACSRCCAAAREASRAPASSCPCCSACGAPRGLALDPPPLDPWVCRKAELWSDWQKGQPPSAGQAASQRERERESDREGEGEGAHEFKYVWRALRWTWLPEKLSGADSTGVEDSCSQHMSSGGGHDTHLCHLVLRLLVGGLDRCRACC